MKTIKVTLVLCCLVYSLSNYAQVNTSQEGNYKIRSSADRYLTQFQNGYAIIKDGTRFDGQISLFGGSYQNLYRVKIKSGDETYNLPMRSLKEFGLSDNLINDTPDQWDWVTMDKVKLMGDPNAPTKPSNTRKASTNYGYVVTKAGTIYQGKITVVEVKKKIDRFTMKTVKKEKFKFEAAELSNFGVGEYGSAVVEEIENEEEEIVSSVVAEEVGYLSTKPSGDSGDGNGYVITSSGERIEGAVSVTAPNKVWFATDVTVTTGSGEVQNYTNDGSLNKVVFTSNGQERELVNFENEYVEVLHREGQLVHFRNPHPTTRSTGGDLANVLVGAAAEGADQEIRREALKQEIKQQGNDVNISEVANKANNIQNSSGQGDVDWTSQDLIKLYAKEYVLLNEKTGKYAIYIPGRNYNQVEGELMGSFEYLKMEKDQQKALSKMESPKSTMQFLNTNLYAK